jgi:non-homologous end joining protein Ku
MTKEQMIDLVEDIIRDSIDWEGDVYLDTAEKVINKLLEEKLLTRSLLWT